eukprot:1940216-Prymnesium_polylepis.2
MMLPRLALVLLSAVPTELLLLSPGVLPHASPRATPTRPCSMVAAEQQEATIAQQVAQWCLSTAGRADAAVLVSESSTTAAVLRDFWSVACDVAAADGEGTYVIALPQWADATDRRYFQSVANHLLQCGEVCEHVCDSIMVSTRHPSADKTDDEPMAA